MLKRSDIIKFFLPKFFKEEILKKRKQSFCMTRLILAAVLLFMSAAIVHAAPVNMERAEQVAAKWFAPDGARSDQGIRNIIVKQYNGYDSL